MRFQCRPPQFHRLRSGVPDDGHTRQTFRESGPEQVKRATNPVGLEYWIVWLTCGFSGLVRSCCDLVLTGESAEDRSAAYLVVGKVDH